jgi:hypothetical protein
MAQIISKCKDTLGTVKFMIRVKKALIHKDKLLYQIRTKMRIKTIISLNLRMTTSLAESAC